MNKTIAELTINDTLAWYYRRDVDFSKITTSEDVISLAVHFTKVSDIHTFQEFTPYDDYTFVEIQTPDFRVNTRDLESTSVVSGEYRIFTSLQEAVDAYRAEYDTITATLDDTIKKYQAARNLFV